MFAFVNIIIVALLFAACESATTERTAREGRSSENEDNEDTSKLKRKKSSDASRDERDEDEALDDENEEEDEVEEPFDVTINPKEKTSLPTQVTLTAESKEKTILIKWQVKGGQNYRLTLCRSTSEESLLADEDCKENEKISIIPKTVGEKLDTPDEEFREYHYRLIAEIGTSKRLHSDTAKSGIGTNIRLTAGANHFCAINSSGALYCWGWNSYGFLGHGGVSSSFSPKQVGSNNDWAEVSAGERHTCAIKKSGGLYCWGDNRTGQLGLASTNLEKTTAPVRVGNSDDWVSVSAGNFHTCAVNKKGQAWCWGSNAFGILGDGTETTRTKPTMVGDDKDWISVHVAKGSFGRSCGVKKNGSLYCWGRYNKEDGTLSSRKNPARESGIGWKVVSVDGFHICGIDRNDKFQCWGKVQEVGAGGNWITDSLTIKQMHSAANWKFASVGVYNAVGITKDGELYCIGRNNAGECGTGKKAALTSLTPVDASSSWVMAHSSSQTICAIRTNGELYCAGELGTGFVAEGIAASTTLVKIGVNLLD